jgi:NADH/NAD ratio-sensing transcriptional regulator Rex
MTKRLLTSLPNFAIFSSLLVKTLNLVNEHELSRQLSIGEHGIRILRRQGLIPFIRFGHRTIRYDIAAVANAIKKLSKEIAA